MQLLDIVKKGSTDRSVTIKIIDSTTGLPETAVEHNTAGIDLWYRREGAAKVSITEAALAALTTAHTDGGIEHIGDGEYRLDLPDAAFATAANHVDIGGTVTDMIVIGGRVRLVDYDPEDSVRMGQTALPNAAADAAGGLPISDAGGLDLDATDATLSTLSSTLLQGSDVAIGTVTSQTQFTLTSGPTKDITSGIAVFTDASDSNNTHTVVIDSYTGSTGVLVVATAPDFTVTTSDLVSLVSLPSVPFEAADFADGSLTNAKFADDAISNRLIATDTLTADSVAADFIGASEIAASASSEIADLIAADWVAGDASPLAIVAALKADGEWSNLSTIAANILTIDGNVTDGFTDTQNQITGLNDVSLAGVADAVWDENQTGHTTVGTFGEIAAEIASILQDTNELQTDLVNGGRLDLLIDAIKAKTDNIIEINTPYDYTNNGDASTENVTVSS